MAFFDLAKKITTGDFSSIVYAFGDLIEPIGGKGTGSFVPAPDCYQEGPEHYQAGATLLDESGNHQQRSQVLTDEGAFRDDFETLVTSLTGTPTFTNGDDVVTGVGTLFTKELNNQTYIKRDVDGETAWAKVSDIISDTQLELDIDYIGASGSSASSKTFWPTSTTGTPGARSVSNSIVTIGSGTTASAITLITREIDYCPLGSSSYASISQRIANQTGIIGLSANKNNPITVLTKTTFHFHTAFITTAAKRVVISIVVETAIP